jgi:hypothetical protein
MSEITSPKSVEAHILRDGKVAGWEGRIKNKWVYQTIKDNPTWFQGWISFDSVTWNSKEKKLYCGLNSLDGDLLYRFSPSTSSFESLGTKQWTDQYDVKIHRTLLLNPKDQCFYFATSQLHDLDQQESAKGGKLAKFDPRTNRFEIIGIPVPHLYIQSIAADWGRNIVYGFTYPAEAVSRTDLQTGKSELLAYIGNATMMVQPHNGVVDGEGCLWGTYAETRGWDETTGPDPVRLFKYHPEKGFTWFDHGLRRRAEKEQLVPDPAGPKATEIGTAETRHRDDWGFCDSMAFDGDHYIYAGSVAGVLSRIDTRTGLVEKIANAMPTARFPALGIKDGIVYGGGGMNGKTQLIRWNTKTDKVELFQDLVAPKINDRPARIHELAIDEEHQLYLGENDNHHRSSYLWTVNFD